MLHFSISVKVRAYTISTIWSKKKKTATKNIFNVIFMHIILCIIKTQTSRFELINLWKPGNTTKTHFNTSHNLITGRRWSEEDFLHNLICNTFCTQLRAVLVKWTWRQAACWVFKNKIFRFISASMLPKHILLLFELFMHSLFVLVK